MDNWYWINAQGEYHEGDPLPGDIAVTQRPSKYHKRVNGEWLEDLGKIKIEKLTYIKQKIAEQDYKTLKFIDGDLTELQYAIYKTYRKALRKAYNDIEKATTIAEVNEVEIPADVE